MPNLTLEQRKILENNIVQIQEWLKPKLSYIDRSIYYKIHHDIYNIELYICKNTCMFNVGLSVYTIVYNHKDRCLEPFIEQSSELLLILLKEWPNIKSLILKEIEEEDKVFDLINNFNV